MSSIIADHWWIPLPVDAVRVHSPAGGGGRQERLAGMEAARMTEALAFLIGYAPGIFDAIFTATEPCAGGDPDPSLEPEPYCTVCGGSAGIFWLLGEEWRHFRPGAGPQAKPEVYDPGHTPVVGWRVGGREVHAGVVVFAPVI